VPKRANVRVAISLTCVAASLTATAAAATLALGAQWRPPDIHPTTATLAEVLAIRAQASRPKQQAAQRRERWTYVNGIRRIAVTVAIRDDDFRTSLDLDGLTYLAGRRGGARWRGDGNGIFHGVQADLQGDALDRVPQAVFPLDSAALTLVGETELPAPTWVIETDRPGDKPAFLYVDKATGTIVREVMRDGKRVVTTAFDRFDAHDGALRAHRWRVDDGSVADRIDVTVDAIEPGAVPVADVAFPERRIFTPATAVPGSPLAASVDLPASFRGGTIVVAVDIDGAREHFLLDTGTSSITIDPRIARRSGGATLEHAVLPKLSVGALQLERVSVLTVPFEGGGILGLDFFFGHVVEIDYRHERVRVLSADDARAVFADSQTAVIAANVDQGLPLVTAAFGPAGSDTFAVDTGSPRLYAMRPFVTRFAGEIAAHWAPAGAPYVERYLEGGIEVQPYRVAEFALGNARAHDLIVGVQLPTTRTDDLAIPFDGIIGTEILSNFDLYFDYDNGRLGLRR